MAIPYYSSEELFIDDYLLMSLLDKGFTPSQIRALGSIKSDSGAFNNLVKTGQLTVDPNWKSAANNDPRLARLVANMTTPFLKSKTLYVDDYIFRALIDSGMDVSALRVMDVVSASPAFDRYRQTGVLEKPPVPGAAANDPRLARVKGALKTPFLQNESILYIDDFILKSLVGQGYTPEQIRAIAKAPNARVNSPALEAFLRGGKLDVSKIKVGADPKDPRLKRVGTALQSKFPGAGPPSPGGVTKVPTGRGTAAPGLTVAQESIKDRVNAVLREYELDSLTPWALDMIKAGHSDARIMEELRKRPEYIKRFPAMKERADNGMAPINEAEYISLERTYKQLMRGKVPQGFYDQNSDFSSFIANDVSPQELDQRINDGYARVVATDPEVRAAFREFYGVNGDAALAAFFLDPDRASEELTRQAGAAVVGGIGKRLGVNVDETVASRINAFSPTESQVQAGFTEAQTLSPLARESVSETQDLSTQTLVASAFGLDADSANAVRRRQRSRMAAFSGGGGSIITQEGATGLGTAT